MIGAPHANQKATCDDNEMEMMMCSRRCVLEENLLPDKKGFVNRSRILSSHMSYSDLLISIHIRLAVLHATTTAMHALTRRYFLFCSVSPCFHPLSLYTLQQTTVSSRRLPVWKRKEGSVLSSSVLQTHGSSLVVVGFCVVCSAVDTTRHQFSAYQIP